jgi:hypothetical protein
MLARRRRLPREPWLSGFTKEAIEQLSRTQMRRSQALAARTSSTESGCAADAFAMLSLIDSWLAGEVDLTREELVRWSATAATGIIDAVTFGTK